MKSMGAVITAIVTVLVVGLSGYWLGNRSISMSESVTSGVTSKAEPRVLYYRNPMGLPDTSPVPKKDSMGMDYVPVYEGGEQIASTSLGQVNISVEKVQKLGVRSEAALMRNLDVTVRAAGRIEIDERRIYSISPKFEGWLEHLYVNSIGQSVRKGQQMFDVYSPDLISAQREYALAMQGVLSMQYVGGEALSSMQQLAASSLARLKNWDIADSQIKQLASGEARRILTIYAPVSGVVLDKKAVQGMRFMPGEMLYRIADLSTVWVIADVSEQDVSLIKVGRAVQVDIAAYPGKSFNGKVDFIYPTLNPATRTVPVRVELANSQGLLKPDMFVNVAFAVSPGDKLLTVPTSAVIDSGLRKIVLVQLAQGRFEPRTVKLGSRSERYVEVLEGVTEGEQVVTSANFLIDAESNLMAALNGMGRLPESEVADVKGDAIAKVLGHHGAGTLDTFNEDGSVTVTHGPIKTLRWPAMSMDFMLANSSLIQGIKLGATVNFEIVEREPGVWVITKLKQGQAAHSQEQGR